MNRREKRLAGLGAIITGAIGTAAVLTGHLPLGPHGDGSLVFPAAVAIGVAVLHMNRPVKS